MYVQINILFLSPVAASIVIHSLWNIILLHTYKSCPFCMCIGVWKEYLKIIHHYSHLSTGNKYRPLNAFRGAGAVSSRGVAQERRTIRGDTPLLRTGVAAVSRYPTSKVRSSGCALLEQLWRDTPCPSRWHHPYGRKWTRTKKPLDASERGEWKSWLKAQHSEN